MLRLVFGVDRDELTFSLVDAMLKAGQPDAMSETEHLDFKAEIPKDKAGRFKLARGITGFANAGGGVLVCGVTDDDNDKAFELTLVSLGGEVANLQRSLNQHLSPSPAFSFLRLEKENGTGLLLIEVPPSNLVPHAVHVDSKPEFVVRRGLENVPMSEQDLERAYRHRFVSRADAESKISEARTAAEHSCPGGGVWLTSVPIMQSRRAYIGPRDGYERFGQLVRAGKLFGPPNFSLGGSQWTTRARRIVCFEHGEEERNYCSLSDEGDFVARFRFTEMERLYESGDRDYSWLKGLDPAPSSYIARRMLFGDLILLFVVLRDVWAHFDLWGQSEVALGIYPGDALFWYTDPSEGGGGELLTEPLELRWQLSLSDLLTPGYVEGLVAEAFEEVTAAFGLLLPKVVTDEGALVAKALGAVSPQWFHDHGLHCV